jgi:DNA-binding transcriptional ArsR family regulator
MGVAPHIASVAGLIGEPARATALCSLVDGTARSASDLARRAKVSAPTMSAHLFKLVRGGLVRVRRAGRQRYYALSGREVASAIEALQSIAPRQPLRVLRTSGQGEALVRARLCYDHVAGRAGVAIAASLQRRRLAKLVADEFALTPAGQRWLRSFGIDLVAARRLRRKFAPCCLDWTERTPHVGGALGAALAARMLALGWFQRRRGSRALQVTDKGHHGLRATFGIAVD